MLERGGKEMGRGSKGLGKQYSFSPPFKINVRKGEGNKELYTFGFSRTLLKKMFMPTVIYWILAGSFLAGGLVRDNINVDRVVQR